MSPAMSFEMKKATQQWSSRVAHDNVLNQVCVYHERVYAGKVLGKFWFVRSYSSQHHSKFTANIATENVFQVRSKKCKTESFTCKININFFRPSRHFYSDTAFAMIVFFLNKCVHGFNNIRNGRVKNRIQIKHFWDKRLTSPLYRCFLTNL